VTITEAMLTEVVHVLSSKVLYNVPRSLIQNQLVALLTLKGMRLRAKGRYLRALEIYAATNLDFVDALLVAQVEQTKDAVVVSFDRDYDKIASVAREEP
jgi:predicted nucleic-acid-binding protein